jgi:hypothetical protein
LAAPDWGVSALFRPFDWRFHFAVYPAANGAQHVDHARSTTSATAYHHRPAHITTDGPLDKYGCAISVNDDGAIHDDSGVFAVGHYVPAKRCVVACGRRSAGSAVHEQ